MGATKTKKRTYVQRWLFFSVFLWFLLPYAFVGFGIALSKEHLWGKILSGIIFGSILISAIIIYTMRIRIDYNGMTVVFMGKVKKKFLWGDIVYIDYRELYGRSLHTHYWFIFKTDMERLTVMYTKRLLKLLKIYSKDCESFRKILGDCMYFIGMKDSEL